MSFATLSSTLDDCSAISALNLTKNPFDSATDGRLNVPALSASPSIFLQADTPGSQKVLWFMSWGFCLSCTVCQSVFVVGSLV